ncbi:hypothetical protein BTM25_53960 [Actinomadura rubteroloni]|uniref:ABC transporter n=1 Tax=Actinomadura rubteroloni TaxID=1926885 RepID=A0A2P4UBM8_9ACTN|nr:hypothetical protein [Actinomadura rubteroloni]POM22446.1 hypothetical protein BTM25_53960 [Actinomadura rubteroloni]
MRRRSPLAAALLAAPVLALAAGVPPTVLAVAAAGAALALLSLAPLAAPDGGVSPAPLAVAGASALACGACGVPWQAWLAAGPVAAGAGALLAALGPGPRLRRAGAAAGVPALVAAVAVLPPARQAPPVPAALAGLALTAVAALGAVALRRGARGRLARAVLDDPDAAALLGAPARAVRAGLGACAAGIAGAAGPPLAAAARTGAGDWAGALPAAVTLLACGAVLAVARRSPAVRTVLDARR